MIHRYIFGGLAVAGLAAPAFAMDVRTRLDLEPLIVKHARANNVPPALVHRIIIRESRYNPRAVGRGGALGLMQIKHATARALGYSGSAEGLLDADTNLAYGVRYLAGAYRVADGDQNRAVGFYARGYYYDAKRRGMLAALAKAPAVAEEPAAAAAAPQPEPPRSIFSLLFAPPRPQEPVQQPSQAAVEEPDAPVAAPRVKRPARPKAAANPVAPNASVQSDPLPAASKESGAGQETAAAAAQGEAAASRSGRPARRTAASGADRSAQKASAQPDDPGTRP
ncbi:MAG: lytic transglycosylase domain-containing protein [Pseudomonadota bacterium]|nr:lytic transglycosylase domain-containing protein [Pseudomonadota bacterium]